MNLPLKSDYINFHDHGSVQADGVFTVDNIMVHENRAPGGEEGLTYSVGAHPWFITEQNLDEQLMRVREMASAANVFAIGECGFDKVKGATIELQKKSFESHFEIAEELDLPLIIHCVKAWPEILEARKRLKPSTPWIIHGFKGKKELAKQLTDKGFYLSAWVEWAIRPVSAETLNSMPLDNLFLETDGFDIGIEPVYKVVAGYLGIELEELKDQIYNNFINLSSLRKQGSHG